MTERSDATAWPDEPGGRATRRDEATGGGRDDPSAAAATGGEPSDRKIADLGPDEPIDQGILEVADLTSEFPVGAAAAYTGVSEDEASDAWRDAREDASEPWPSGRAEEEH